MRPLPLLTPLVAAALVLSGCSDSTADPEACGDQDASTLVTIVTDVDGDGADDSIRLTRGVIATCTGSGDDVFEHPFATEHIVAWSFGDDHPMGLLFGSSTVSLLELQVATWTDDGWQVVTHGLDEPLMLRAGSAGDVVERTDLYDHQCGDDPTEIVSTEVDMRPDVPVITTTTWQIDGTTATATDVETHEDDTVNPAIWFQRRPTVDCPWMQE